MGIHSSLTQSVHYLNSVGEKRAKAFSDIGIETIYDLLYYFPTRYLDRSTLIDSNKVFQYINNGYDGEVTIIGKVTAKDHVRYHKKQFFKVSFVDNEGTFDCVWFQGVKYFKNRFNPGEFYAISAKPSITKYGSLQFSHPDFDRIEEEESEEFKNTGKIIPFYRIPKELKSGKLGDIGMRNILRNAVEEYSQYLTETMPEKVVKEHNLMPIWEAVRNLHLPESHEKLKLARNRFKFEELFYIECLVALKKEIRSNKISGHQFKIKGNLVSNFYKSLPFQLTEAQLKVLSEIKVDMALPKPMNRLVQGDVGSGKTIVALIAMLIAIENGYQCAIMAPTEILASQHFKNITNMLKETGVRTELLLGGPKSKAKKKSLEEIGEGNVDIVIGTHAVLEDTVSFKNLGLAVIDEQHRFGVLQRSKLINKNISPDVLVMTATPIPRTLSMTVYGDLDLSLIDMLPANRKPIQTALRGENKLPDIYKFITDKIAEGYQSYIVYPLVEESEKLDLKAAEEQFAELKETYFKNYKVGLLHGRMKWQEKEDAMLRFAAKEFDILISTTVIEVGIDIPDANIILINDAHRFGLSQLHQLRGRVGRSDKKAYCILVTKEQFATKSNTMNFDFEYLSRAEIERHKSAIRLNSMVKTSSGFDLSEIDLKLRGPGNIFGTEQSGLPALMYSNLTEDQNILVDAKQAAFSLVEADPSMKLPDNKILKEILMRHYRENIILSQIG
ncbi:MAG: ATP-dependent DNA helicase RecG [Rhodothermaceae bacterium]